MVGIPGNDNLPRIGVTLGDPAGIGPEICCRLLGTPVAKLGCIPIVFGDHDVLVKVASRLRIRLTAKRLNAADDLQTTREAAMVHIPVLDHSSFEPGNISENTGAASFEYIESAIAVAKAGFIDGVTTGPINKQAWHAAKIQFPGHTELFADRFQTNRFCMMMTAPAFSCSLVTTHIGYHEVPTALSPELIVEVIQLTHEALTKIKGKTPALTVLGLNPHAGENGLFGDQEEERVIQPAIERGREFGIELEGPLPPDTAFLPWKREATDGYICMYHDQGLIPFKAFNFDTGVNITLGLPTVRTSVDHGTALDIAWQGKADVSSLISAVSLAAKLAK